MITISANYEGVPNTLLGTVPLYNMETVGEDEAARLAFVAPLVNAPIVVPISVRSNSDYGLRMTFSTITQSIALASASTTIWGFPADPTHDPERFPPGTRPNRPAAPTNRPRVATKPPSPRPA